MLPQGASQGEITSDNVPLTPSKLSGNEDLFSVYSSSQITEPPQTLPQIPGQVHSPVENQQRQTGGGLPTGLLAHSLSLSHWRGLKGCLSKLSKPQTLFPSVFFFFYSHHLGVTIKSDVGLAFSPVAIYFHVFSSSNRSSPLTIRRTAEGRALTFLSRDVIKCAL